MNNSLANKRDMNLDRRIFIASSISLRISSLLPLIFLELFSPIKIPLKKGKYDYQWNVD